MPEAGRTVLTIGGDGPTARLLAFLFSSHGYRVITAPDPEAARVRPAHRPDLILLDADSADRGALALLQHVKRTHPDLPVIVLASSAEPDDAASALEGGTDGYVAKPFDPEELVARSEAVLRRVRFTQTRRIAQRRRALLGLHIALTPVEVPRMKESMTLCIFSRNGPPTSSAFPCLTALTHLLGAVSPHERGGDPGALAPRQADVS